MRHLLIHRDYATYTGGHGKFLDYIAHINAHPDWEVLLYLTPRSRGMAGNPFLDVAALSDTWCPQQADALLLGGMDWAALDGHVLRADQLVLNLVQGVRHADPDSTLRGFLHRRALRVCVSTAVADAIVATGEVNGPVRVVPAAVDVARLSRLGTASPRHEVFIDAVKRVELGRDVARRLVAAGADVDLLVARLPRPDYLARMADAGVVVALPERIEGFFLPGIEAMAMGRALVQYDCVGSRDYLRDGVNSCVPAPAASAIVEAALRLRADAGLRQRLAVAAQVAARDFDLSIERQRVHALLDGLAQSWTN